MKQTVDWHQHWTNKNPGFHEGQVNPYLQQYLPLFELQAGDTVFMPLCGKAVDILWLAEQGYKVIGVELSGVAVESFFEESGLEYTQHTSAEFEVYQAGNITLYQGDFMDLQVAQLTSCKLVYDRAAIVAIESFNRAAYKAKIVDLLPPGTPILMVTFTYTQQQMTGPPFSVPVEEITELYESEYQITPLQSGEQIDSRPRWKANGLTSLIETALSLTPRSTPVKP